MFSILPTILLFTSAASSLNIAPIYDTTYAGCYTDLQGALNGQRALAKDSYTDPQMYVAFCAARMARYAFFGVEYGTECYGANYITPGSVVVADAECSMPCAGNGSQACGAGYRVNLYRNNVVTPVWADAFDCSATATPTVTSVTTRTQYVAFTVTQNVTVTAFSTVTAT